MAAWPDDISWSQIQSDYFNPTFNEVAPASLMSEIEQDQRLSQMFDTAFFDADATHVQRMDARDELRDYLADNYGLDVDDVFDWDAWRDAYGSQ